MNRRNFNSTITAGGLALAAPVSCGDTRRPHASTDLPLHFIYETRLLDPAGALPSWCAQASRSYAITGDVTPVWYHELHRHWERRSISTGGLTYEAEFFVLKTLARDYDYEVTVERYDGDRVRWLLEPRSV
ncbi:MAG: hypothetical protein QF609_00510 [Gammaproteobacteria bacterium]|jgi:hypothetical protein|nr:hypothetical protein [Gammaproteobacteria bacterium]HJP36164.1 hypothetical protein [Gammaproteobacteria bacterium]